MPTRFEARQLWKHDGHQIADLLAAGRPGELALRPPMDFRAFEDGAKACDAVIHHIVYTLRYHHRHPAPAPPEHYGVYAWLDSEWVMGLGSFRRVISLGGASNGQGIRH